MDYAMLIRQYAWDYYPASFYNLAWYEFIDAMQEENNQ